MIYANFRSNVSIDENQCLYLYSLYHFSQFCGLFLHCSHRQNSRLDISRDKLCHVYAQIYLDVLFEMMILVSFQYRLFKVLRCWLLSLSSLFSSCKAYDERLFIRHFVKLGFATFSCCFCILTKLGFCDFVVLFFDTY